MSLYRYFGYVYIADRRPTIDTAQMIYLFFLKDARKGGYLRARNVMM